VTSQPIIVWFRQDLRVADHPALSAAAADGRPVVPVYVLDDETPGPWRLGGASRWWLHGALTALAESLASLGAPLVLRRGPAATVIADLVRETGATTVYWTDLVEPHWRTTAADLEDRLTGTAVEARAFPGAYLHPLGTVVGRSGHRPKVFTPFWKACLAGAPPHRPVSVPGRLRPMESPPAGETVAAWRLTPAGPNWAGGLRDAWTPGEAAAKARLLDYLDNGVGGYAADRNRPEPAATSRLSPHLHFGEVSPRQVWHATRQRMDANARIGRGAEAFLREVGWREFCQHVLADNPQLADAPLQERFAGFPWAEDEALLEAWRRGRTGYPIVDAGMRELWTTGWMHNRVRMITASFLVKHLLQPWIAGEAWFWDTLVDADMGNNAGGWQWVAGCGTDATPYFRIFNPTLQAEKFDAGGAYVRRWVPELARLPDRWLNRPWEAPPLELEAAGIRLSEDFPRPIVDHDAARRRALAAFESIK